MICDAINKKLCIISYKSKIVGGKEKEFALKKLPCYPIFGTPKFQALPKSSWFSTVPSSKALLKIGWKQQIELQTILVASVHPPANYTCVHNVLWMFRGVLFFISALALNFASNRFSFKSFVGFLLFAVSTINQLCGFLW